MRRAWLGMLMMTVGVITLTACTQPADDNEADNNASNPPAEMENETADSAAPTDNIVELAQSNSQLSTLVAAVTAAQLAEALSDSGVELTVFAPTNAAFAEIQSTVDTLLEPANLADLQNVLQYHVVPGAVMSSELRDGQTIETLGGETLTVTIKDGAVYINNAMVQTPDVEATNGVVHVIDKVLVPGYQTIASLATGTEDLSTLVAALQAADLVSAVADPTAELTVFAPTNAAFAEIQSTVDTLLEPANQAQLSDVLLYHVAQGKVMAADLTDGQTITMLNGDQVTVSINGDTVQIGAATVSTADLEAANGVVHVIDTVLVP